MSGLRIGALTDNGRDYGDGSYRPAEFKPHCREPQPLDFPPQACSNSEFISPDRPAKLASDPNSLLAVDTLCGFTDWRRRKKDSFAIVLYQPRDSSEFVPENLWCRYIRALFDLTMSVGRL